MVSSNSSNSARVSWNLRTVQALARSYGDREANALTEAHAVVEAASADR